MITGGSSWPWSYGSWIYNYLCNQCLSPLMLWVRISIRARCTTLCDKVCQWLATGLWFSPPIKLTATIYNWNIVESGVKHHQTNKTNTSTGGLVVHEDIIYSFISKCFSTDIIHKIYLLNTLYFMMKYIWNTAEIRLHMDKSNIYFSNGIINCGKTLNGM